MIVGDLLVYTFLMCCVGIYVLACQKSEHAWWIGGIALFLLGAAVRYGVL